MSIKFVLLLLFGALYCATTPVTGHNVTHHGVPLLLFPLTQTACPGGVTDICGVCNGTSFDPTTCVRGCDGRFGSTLRYDVCSVCDGDNSTCVCPTTRAVGWLVLALFLTTMPLFVFAVFRLFVFVDESEPGWLVTLRADEITDIGTGAYRTKLAREAHHGTWVHTIILSMISWIVVVLRFLGDWTSSESLVCARIELGTTYSVVLLTISALISVLAATRYCMYARSVVVAAAAMHAK